MPLPIIAPVVATIASWSVGAAFVASIIAGILRVITLLGVAVAVFEGIDTFAPYITDLLNQTTTVDLSNGTGGIPPVVAQLFDVLRVQEAISLLLGAVSSRMAFRTSLILSRAATGGT
ncbi:DUF2523 family protein [Hydrocarboniphaga effusa]|jgi:hypothetical protein|uniref:DUF2523 family protein n=1 Tax=Hydrocarboniphaga effusa TaxID=243629 RepID=UPI00398BD445